MWGEQQSNTEQISFVLSNLKREAAQQQQQQQQHGRVPRRRAVPGEGVDGGGDGPDACDIENGEGHTDSDIIFVDGVAQRPPKLRQRRSCCVTITLMWSMIVIAAVFVVIVELYHMHSSTIEEKRLIEKRVARDDGVKDRAGFGVWDQQSRLTPLQLQVAVSLALGVRANDDDVHVTKMENFFFAVSVEHATGEEIDYINGETFIETLNEHVEHYEALCVISQRARLVKSKKVDALV